MRSTRSRTRLAGTPGAAPVLDHLERRLALDASMGPFGLLRITGNATANTVVLSPGPELGQVVLSGVPNVEDGTVFSGVQSVRADLKSGNDTFSMGGTVRAPDNDIMSILVLFGNGADLGNVGEGINLVEFRGGNGEDTLTGGPSDDTLKGGKRGDTLRGEGGQDQLEGQLGPDLLIGGESPDRLFGGNGRDSLWGNGGFDRLFGDAGPDTLVGGAEGDELRGGDGFDTYYGGNGELFGFGPQDVDFDIAVQNFPGAALVPVLEYDRLAQREEEGGGVLDVAVLVMVRQVQFLRSLTGFARDRYLEEVALMEPEEQLEFTQFVQSLVEQSVIRDAANPQSFTFSNVIDLAQAAAQSGLSVPEVDVAIATLQNSLVAFPNQTGGLENAVVALSQTSSSTRAACIAFMYNCLVAR